MSYVIRNCPCYCEKLLSHDFSTNTSKVADKGVCIGSISNSDYHCQNCTDCVMKQIVERCREAQKEYPRHFPDGELDMFVSGRNNLAGITLALLDIQEVNR